jgi:glycosyltransferase involved in cell wall biosynthesis
MSPPDAADRPGRSSVSVAMATWNGAAYVKEQVHSILAQLTDGDELVVVDDASQDDTVAVIRAVGDDRVRVVEAPVNRGYVATFEVALRECRNDVMFLADQDDVWPAGRVEAMSAALATADVVAGNLELLGTGEPLRSPYGGGAWRLRADDSSRHLRNVGGVLAGARPYYGCAMGVRRRALDVVLPFPSVLTESHDLWIALCGNLMGSMAHVEDLVVLRRQHDTNQTMSDRPRGVLPALRSRLMLLRCVALILVRLARRRRTITA